MLVGSFSLFGQAPVAAFTANNTSGCAPLTVAFTDQSTGNPTTYNWEFSNGTLSNAKNPAVTFSTPGTYTAKLVVQNANGISQVEKVNYITVAAAPTANFSANVTLGCVPSTINFTDLSTDPVGSIVGWSWDFGDGGTSNVQNPSHVYNNEGIYTVLLTITSSTGCKQTITRGSFIRIVGAVTTDFAFSKPASCKGPFAITFTNQSIGPGTITYAWDFGNGQTSTALNPVVNYANPGTYTVRLTTRSTLGCTGFMEKQITIGSLSTDFVIPTNTCLNSPLFFLNNSGTAPISSFWDFGDGTTSAQIAPEKTYLLAGSYQVKLINQYSDCTDSITKTVVVNNKPVVNFIASDSSFCAAPASVQFTDLTAGATNWLWDFGDGTTSTDQNPQHTFASEGDYRVTLTASTNAGCSNAEVKLAYIKVHAPIIRINNAPAGGCIPYSFTPSLSLTTVDSVATYAWNFGNGQTSGIKNPTNILYPVAGNYDVSLTITTVSGCTQTISYPSGVRTGVPPTPSFTTGAVDVCAGTPTIFTNTSTTTPGAYVQYAWDFGDGSIIDTTENPSHLFEQIGNINVRFTVINNGCPATITRAFIVRPPVAGFKDSLSCLTKQVYLIDTSLVDPAIPVAYLWEFPGGGTSTLKDPGPQTFPVGTSIVKLTVTQGTCVYATTQTVKIPNEPATFNINKTPVCKNETFRLTANTQHDPENWYTWTVNGVALAPSRTDTLEQSINAYGSYPVTLSVTDRYGCVTTTTQNNFIVVAGPVADFIPATTGGCLEKTAVFTDRSTPAGGITNWKFNFGDGTIQDFSAGPFTHTYTRLGAFPVTLTVTDGNGCSDTKFAPSQLLVSNPKSGFRADTFYCPQSPLQFVDSSAGIGLNYRWDFGDGGTSTLQNPTHSFPAGDGDYTVQLIVTDQSGCIDTATRAAYVKIRKPKPTFGIQDTVGICPPLNTSFFFQGTDYQSFSWAFGDGGTSTIRDPKYFYSNYGSYSPTLYAYGPGGCVDSAKASVTLYNPSSIRVTQGPRSTGCNSLTVDFNFTVPAGFKFAFFFGDGTADSSGRSTLTHFYSKPSFNTPYLLITDTSSGCKVAVYGPSRIDVLGAIPLFGVNKTEFCDNGTVSFTDYTTKNDPITSAVWNFGDGSTTSNPNPQHTYTQPGMYIATLDITTQNNCNSSFVDTIFVYRTPTPVINGRDTICTGITEPFTGSVAIADSITTYLWNFGAGQTSTQPNISVSYPTGGSYNIQLIASNKLGCADTTIKTVFVSPPPTVTPLQDPITMIVGASTNLLMNYTGTIASYNWTPQYRLNCFDCPAPVANPATTTKYRVDVEDILGCKGSGEVNVIVLCNGQNFFIPNTFSPNGDGKNEVFYPRGTGIFRIKSMTLFNRWGQVIFERKEFAVNDPSKGWDGTFKGQKVSSDVYIYMVEILCDNNTIIPVKGNVTLLR